MVDQEKWNKLMQDCKTKGNVVIIVDSLLVGRMLEMLQMLKADIESLKDSIEAPHERD